jgi:hypothetical protein
MRYFRNTAILIGLAVYLTAFYATPLPDVPDDAGQPMWRGKLLMLLFLRPDDWLFSHWFGSPPQFSLVDRLPVLFVAGLILSWAATLGWLLMVLCRLCGPGVSPGPTRAGGTPALQLGGTPAPHLTRLETFVFALAVGLGAVSTWVLAMGLLGRLDRTWTFIVPAVATFLIAACVWYRRRRREANRRRLTAAGLAPDSRYLAGAAVQLPLQHSPPQRPGYCHDVLRSRWLWLALPFTAAILLAAMLPPLDFDVCEYHLQAPKEFFQQGKVAFLPHNVYANMTLGTEMLSLLAMVVAGDWWWGALAGKTVIAAFTPLCALALYAAGRRFYSTGAGVTAALLYISVPWMVSISSAGLVEGASACYLFLAVYALLLAKRDRLANSPNTWDRLATCPTSYLILAGYLAGAAVATKYPAAMFVLLPLAAWSFFGRFAGRARGQGSGVRGQDGKSASVRELNPEPRTLNPILSAVAALMIFLLAAAAGCGLWFGKNWVQCGNPTYPLLYGVFGGKTWNAEKDRRWNSVHRPTDFSAKTLAKDLRRVALTSEWLSPLIVPLAALAFVGWGRRSRWGRHSCLPLADRSVCPTGQFMYPARRLVWGLLVYVAFVVAVWWLFTHRIDRFWIPALPLMALLAGVGACWSSEAWWRRLLKGLLLAGLLANFLVATAGPSNAWFVPLEQLRKDWHWITSWHWRFNNDADLGGVLTVGDAAVFDLTPTPVLYNTCFDDCIFEQLVKGKTAEQVRAALASRHIAYVFVNWGEIVRYRRPGNYGFTEFVQPKVFDRLVERGVLQPLPPERGRPERAYRVLATRSAPPAERDPE